MLRFSWICLVGWVDFETDAVFLLLWLFMLRHLLAVVVGRAEVHQCWRWEEWSTGVTFMFMLASYF